MSMIDTTTLDVADAPECWRERERLRLLHLRGLLEGFEVERGTESLEPPATNLETVILTGRFQPGHAAGWTADQLRQILAAPQWSGVEPHPDDVAVDRFAALMKAKLAASRAKGRGGWDEDADLQQILSDQLREHVDKGDPVDVANYCLFLSARGVGIAAPAADAD